MFAKRTAFKKEGFAEICEVGCAIVDLPPRLLRSHPSSSEEGNVATRGKLHLQSAISIAMIAPEAHRCHSSLTSNLLFDPS